MGGWRAMKLPQRRAGSTIRCRGPWLMVVQQRNELQMHGILPLMAATDADRGYLDKRNVHTVGPLIVGVDGS